MTATSATGAPSLAIVGAQPAKRRQSEALGYVSDPDTFFAKEKTKILEDVGDLSGIRLPLNRILLAVWVRPTSRTIAGTEGRSFEIKLPDAVVNEDKWQGVSGLVLAMGPHTYEDNDAIKFQDSDRCEVGDWVMFRRGEGFRTRIWGRECVVLDSERGVKMVLDRPDTVY